MSTKLPNTWTVQEAAVWAGLGYRRLLDLFHDGLLPCIILSANEKVQHLPRGQRRRRRAAKILVPREAFVSAWRNFSGAKTSGNYIRTSRNRKSTSAA